MVKIILCVMLLVSGCSAVAMEKYYQYYHNRMPVPPYEKEQSGTESHDSVCTKCKEQCAKIGTSLRSSSGSSTTSSTIGKMAGMLWWENEKSDNYCG
jgi:hypothetical protein